MVTGWRVSVDGDTRGDVVSHGVGQETHGSLRSHRRSAHLGLHSCLISPQGNVRVVSVSRVKGVTKAEQYLVSHDASALGLQPCRIDQEGARHCSVSISHPSTAVSAVCVRDMTWLYQ
jgi:hypothetical protein